MKSLWKGTSFREKVYGLLLAYVCGQGYFLAFLFGMMFAPPILKCLVNGELATCAPSEACSGDYSVDSENSDQNLSLKYRLVCENEYKIRYAEQIIMAQSLLAILFVVLVNFNR
jgi:hypothetical protein